MPGHAYDPEDKRQDVAAERVPPHGDPQRDTAPHETQALSEQPDVAPHETQPTGDEAAGGESEDVRSEVLQEDLPEEGVALDGTPVDQLQQERAERLDPANRPENDEVDNTQRDFDVEKGMFTDNPDYEDAPKKFPPLGEQGA